MSRQKRRKQVGSVLAAVILAGGLLPYNVLAQEVKAEVSKATEMKATEGNVQIKREQAIQRAKEILDIPSVYKEERVELESNQYIGRTVWNLSWSYQQSPQDYRGINISIDAEDGTIVSINRWSGADDRPGALPGKLSYNSTVSHAKALLAKYYGKYEGQLRLDPTSEESFRQNSGMPYAENVLYFERYQNGIPVSGQGLRISYDKKGVIRSLDFTWNKQLVFSGDQAKSKDEIMKSVTDKLEMEVAYLPNMERANGKMELAYVPSISAVDSVYSSLPYAAIDARTGKPLDINSGQEITVEAIAAEPLSRVSSSIPSNLNLDANQAVEKARQFLKLDDKMEIQNKSYREENVPHKRKIWDISWRSKDGTEKYASATIDAQTGELISANQYGMAYDMRMREGAVIAVNVDQKQARAKAEEFVRRALPGRLANLYTADVKPNLYNGDPNKLQGYTVSFARKENGVRVVGEGAFVGVDCETGDITSYYMSWSKLPLPKVESVISAEDAKKKVIGLLEAKLQYLAINLYGSMDNPKPQLAKLVYVISVKNRGSMPYYDRPQYLDARTGELKQYGNQPVDNTGIPVQDIKGHALEKELQEMVDSNLIEVKNGKVNPDQKLTRGELVNLLKIMHRQPYDYYSNTANPTFTDVGEDNEYNGAVEWAIQQRLLKKEGEQFHPEAAATREFLSEIIVRGLGFDKLADMEEIFDAKFADASLIKRKGYAALVERLRIMNRNAKGEFGPNQQLTKAEAAVIVYRYLQIKDKINE